VNIKTTIVYVRNIIDAYFIVIKKIPSEKIISVECIMGSTFCTVKYYE